MSIGSIRDIRMPNCIDLEAPRAPLLHKRDFDF